jgi:sodium/bile acid cotransporter 7
MVLNSIKKNWFLLGLISVVLLTLADTNGIVTYAGIWLKTHHGPDLVIVLIFFLSGLVLDTSRIREGGSDYRGTITALILIFISAPLLTLPFTLLPLDTGVLLGLFLVSVMPSTLSSGVVMTGSAGGNMAHALLITIIANSLAVITIPFSLNLLLNLTGYSRAIEINQLPIMIKIATLVLLPLRCGMALRRKSSALTSPPPYTGILSQIGILSMVWMALCSGREAIVANVAVALPILIIIFIFHLAMILCGIAMTRLWTIEKGRRESVILMGGQKTLPLSVILQVSLFPEYGTALVVCVLHHIVHLIMDAFLTRYLKEKG